MLKVVIIGASAAGHTVAISLREKNKDCAISLVTRGNYPLYDKRLLGDYLAGRVKESQIFLATENFYSEQNVGFLKQKEISGLNCEKRKIFIQDSLPLEYDFLAVCSGTDFALPEIPGARKTGVFRLSNLDKYRDFLAYLIGEPVCVVGSGRNALEAARVLAIRQKEVKLISAKVIDPCDIPEGVEFINSSVVEVIGESGAQAIKIKEGKIIGISALIFMDSLEPNTAFLRNSCIATDQGYISVDDRMRTSLARVYSSGSVCRLKNSASGFKSWDQVIEESRFLSVNLLQDMA
jgi:nitrite reductase (NADH) large subunit